MGRCCSRHYHHYYGDPINLIPKVAAYKAQPKQAIAAYVAGEIDPSSAKALSALAAARRAALAARSWCVNYAHQKRDVALGLP